MNTRSSEKLLREFVRLSQHYPVLAEAGVAQPTQLNKAIELIQNNAAVIGYCLDYYENPIQPSFTITDYKLKLKALVTSAIEIDKGNNTPLALILLSTCFGNMSDYTNFVSQLGDIRAFLRKMIMREAPGRPRPRGPVRSGATGAKAGEDFGNILMGPTMAAIRSLRMDPEIAEEMARIISVMLGGQQGARNIIKSGNLPTGSSKVFDGIDPNTNRLVRGSEELPFIQAVRKSMGNVHEIDELKQLASPQLRDALDTVNYEFTEKNLEEIANSGVWNNSITSEATDLLARAKAKLDASVTPENAAAIMRAVAWEETRVIRGASAKMRPAITGALPATLLVAAAASVMTGITAIWDLLQSNPTVPIDQITTATVELLVQEREALRALADAFYRAGLTSTHGAILNLIPQIGASASNVDSGLNAIAAAMAQEK